MHIIVLSRRLACLHDAAEHYAVISITDPPPHGEPARIPQRWGLRAILPLAFMDYDRDMAEVNGDTLYLGKPYRDWCMTEAHGDNIAAFVAEHAGVPCIVVHCEAGASRSPSVAMAIADYLKLSRRRISWGEQRTNVLAPNRWVYDVTIEAMVRHGKVRRAADAGAREPGE